MQRPPLKRLEQQELELPKIKIAVIILSRLAGLAGLAARGRQIAKTHTFGKMEKNSSIMRFKLHLMTIIRLISLAPMLGDKVPCKFSLNAVVGFATQLHPPCL